MSVEVARQLVARLQSDSDLVEQLQSAAPEERGSIVEAEGYATVTQDHVTSALPEHLGRELTDEEVDAVSGGDSTWDIISGIIEVIGA